MAKKKKIFTDLNISTNIISVFLNPVFCLWSSKWLYLHLRCMFLGVWSPRPIAAQREAQIKNDNKAIHSRTNLYWMVNDRPMCSGLCKYLAQMLHHLLFYYCLAFWRRLFPHTEVTGSGRWRQLQTMDPIKQIMPHWNIKWGCVLWKFFFGHLASLDRTELWVKRRK